MLVIKCCLLNGQAAFINQQLQQQTPVTAELKAKINLRDFPAKAVETSGFAAIWDAWGEQGEGHSETGWASWNSTEQITSG